MRRPQRERENGEMLSLHSHTELINFAFKREPGIPVGVTFAKYLDRPVGISHILIYANIYPGAMNHEKLVLFVTKMK